MAVKYLTCVIEDGSPSTDLSIPVDPRVALEIIQGTSNQIVCRIVNPAGVPVAPVGSLTMRIKQKPQDEPDLAYLEGTWTPLLGPGTAVLSWTTAHMANSPWGWYVYDVRLTVGAEVNMLIPASPFRLAPAL